LKILNIAQRRGQLLPRSGSVHGIKIPLGLVLD